MNTDQKAAKNINATATLSIADAVARGYLVKRPTGYHAAVGGAAVQGDTVTVQINTGAIV